jgi:Fe2+ or Zn2+ uptake regulation protein
MSRNYSALPLDGSSLQEREAWALECLRTAGVRPKPERVEALTLLLRNRGKMQTVRELMSLHGTDEARSASTNAAFARITLVYRALGALVDSGLVEREVREDRGRAVFGFRLSAIVHKPTTANQVHYECRQCGRASQSTNLELHKHLSELGFGGNGGAQASAVVVLFTCAHCTST